MGTTFNSEGNEVTSQLLKATHKYACTYAHSEEDKKIESFKDKRSCQEIACQKLS